MTVWALKGSLREQVGREAAVPAGLLKRIPQGLNTAEEMDFIADATATVGDQVIQVITSAYHVPRAYLTLLAACRRRGLRVVVHVLGVGETTNLQAQSEAAKLADAQAKGHALKWEDV